MEYQLAARLLEKVNCICPRPGFDWLSLCRTLVQENKATLFNAFWTGSYVGRNQANSLWTKPELTKETSYDKCCFPEISTAGGRIYLAVQIYDGRLLDGIPEGSRCRFELQLPPDQEVPTMVVAALEDRIRTLMINQLNWEDEQRQERRLKRRIEKFKHELVQNK